ncbi:phage tail protein [Actinoplanes lobatus]|uniref:Phage tail protein n=1 Tax=Actinoplanes lobatus TaxID=113568 RepID=A0A7W7HM78_9ACTN|nr:phage tail protein [Actinoplanes lobatus]MBB4753128.1 phage tail-like protein [Actinoplanes lobatus]GGN58806.1 phage tail protein [Actinoplanes lobatus]GIE43012.1 phage tail protein [Actinoplanes lobatus]
MATGVRKDPFRNSNFILEIDGIEQAGFTEVTGMGVDIAVAEYQEGGHVTPRKLPGQVTYPNITLKWGLTDSRELYDWFRDVARGIVQRRDGSIILQDQTGTERARWNFENAWPRMYRPGDMVAKSNDVAIESLELVCEFLERA